MNDYSTVAGAPSVGSEASYSVDAFGRDIRHDEVHTPEAFLLIARAQSFASLPDDWDGYGASAPSVDVVDLAYDVLTAFDKKGCLPTRVMPGVADDIGMLWERPDFRALLEFSLEGWDWSIEYTDGREALFFEAEGSVGHCAELVRKSMLEA